jgi:hypothetical protein
MMTLSETYCLTVDVYLNWRRQKLKIIDTPTEEIWIRNLAVLDPFDTNKLTVEIALGYGPSSQIGKRGISPVGLIERGP